MYLAICDDNHNLRRELVQLLETYPWKQPMRLKEYHSGDHLWFDYSCEPGFDCLILDIEMPGMSGLELAKKIRDRNDDIPIVLLTAFDKYALAGYDVHPFQYLLKPVKREKLFEVLAAIEELLEHKHKRCLHFQTQSGFQRILLSSISFIESKDRHIYIHLHASQQVYQFRIKLDEVEEMCDDHFLRPHKSFLINAERIKDISYKDRCIWLEDGSKIPISQRRKGVFSKDMAEYAVRYGTKFVSS